ncbi:MAG: hypothetical protein IKZ30_01365 [Oscillospiraceae bacterium]|nr:hypothetical protein [Oscillospiraceae bacterium]
MRAIVYTSNTGHTEKYARILAEKTGLPVYSLEKAQKTIPSAEKIIYLGWVCASKIKGYDKAVKLYDIAAVCGVCMGATGSQLSEIRRINSVKEHIPVFTMRGGVDYKKLRGINKMILKAVTKGAANNLTSNTERTEEERIMLELMVHGGNCVSEEALNDLLEWYEGSKN